ncbi:MAG TPA: anti-sigma factor antagonist [Verrucomicrobiales bacterium]|nr:anti-sigma factor antagonist [Verrucomicrobiales bacterium]
MDVCIYERRDGQNIFTIERKLRHGSGRSALTHIGVTKFGSSAVLALTGRLEGHSSPELEQQVNALLHSGIRSLIFDLSALEYVSSAGLRVFILAAKKLKSAGGDARFAALTAWVREVFHVSGLLTTLEVVPTVESVLPITPPAATRPK